MADHRRVLYVQFTDPAAYPPLEHSSQILAERGWEVLFLGAKMSRDTKLEFPKHSRIRVKTIKISRGGWLQKVQYLLFFFSVLYWTCRWRPSWIYASDPLVCPIVYLVQKLGIAKVLYHEHDTPGPDFAQSWFMKQVSTFRGLVGRSSDLCVLPQHQRLRQFVESVQRSRSTLCVWNCPRRNAVRDIISCERDALVIYYHGNISSDLVPRTLMAAASRFNGGFRVEAAGYEAPGSRGYVNCLSALGAAHGLEFKHLGVMPREALSYHVARADVGLALMPKQSRNVNIRHLVGASNKAFDYMACGLPLLVSNIPEWIETFVDPGYARACDPDDVASIEAELRWFFDNPKERTEMGLRGQNKVRQDWNYDILFADVLNILESTSS